MNRIPSVVALSHRGISVQNSCCHFCNVEADDTNHFLIKCNYARDCLTWIFNWCNIGMQQFQSVGELVKFAAILGNYPKKCKILLAIIYGYLWCTWKARDDKVFNNVRIPSKKLADNIFSLGFS